MSTEVEAYNFSLEDCGCIMKGLVLCKQPGLGQQFSHVPEKLTIESRVF
jgi:hypothetical protein